MESEEEKVISEEVKPIINGMGYDLVDVKVGKSKHLEDVTIVIYKADGVSLNNCVDVSRNIKMRLDLLEDFENLALKVTSPGIDRNIKGRHEYSIFKERGVKLLLIGSSDWVGGIIKNEEGGKLTLKCRDKMLDIDISSIKKAKLDYAEEVKNR